MVHKTAMDGAKLFFDAYVAHRANVTVVEIGSQDVNGSIRDVFGNEVTYIGLDFAAAKGVDRVLDDPYSFPFAEDEVDVLVSSSCFEHSEFFWLTFVEGIRILRPGGLFYLNAPSNGPVHRYPVDCWRFYPDAGQALAKWAGRQGHDVILLESYTSKQQGEYFNDHVSVFLKDRATLPSHPNRILHSFQKFTNGYVDGEGEIRNPRQFTEDQRAIRRLLQNR